RRIQQQRQSAGWQHNRLLAVRSENETRPAQQPASFFTVATICLYGCFTYMESQNVCQVLPWSVDRSAIWRTPLPGTISHIHRDTGLEPRSVYSVIFPSENTPAIGGNAP